MNPNDAILSPPESSETHPFLRISPYNGVEVATIFLNRPKHRNRISSSDISIFRQHIETVNAREHVKATIITANVPHGTRVFSAGFDINELAGDAGPAANNAGFEALADAVYKMRPVTFAIISGDIYGGATDLALACDFRIGIDAMVLKMPAAKLGLHYYPNGLMRAIKTLGLPTTKRMFLTAETFSAAQLSRFGWLDDCSPEHALNETTQRWLEKITNLDSQAVEGMKQTINEISTDVFNRETAFQRISDCHHSETFQSNLRKFTEDRT